MKKLLFKGPVFTASGYGVHARQLLRALLVDGNYDISVHPIKWGETPYIYEENALLETAKRLSMKAEMERQSNVKYDVSIQVSIPNEFEKLAAVNIGVTAGIEVDHVSHQWLLKCNENIDLLIVPSKHSADVFARSKFNGSDGSTLELQKPMVVASEGVETAIFNTEPVDSSQFDIAPDFNFIYVGLGLDKAPGEDRKNVSELVKWFCEKFKGDENVGLVLKTGIVNGSLMDFEMTKKRISELKNSVAPGKNPQIKLIHGRLSDVELASLYKHPKVKAFISLTHGEGFGLPLLEAAACGLPVITTNWSGHLDFLTVGDRKLFVPVDFKMGNIPDSVVWEGVLEKGTNWAYPDENNAKTQMNKVYRSYEKPKAWATELAGHVAENFSLQKTGYDFMDIINGFLISMSATSTTSSDRISIMKSQIVGATLGEKSLLYTMPMSAGDIVISTGVVNSLKKKYPDHKIFFATEPKYFELLTGNSDIFKVIEWQQWMVDVSLCEQIFDEVYTPNLAIQMVYSNWIHKGKGRLLGEEMANHCHVEFGEYHVPVDESAVRHDKEYVLVHPGSGTGQWEARNYLHWQEVITNLKNMLPAYEIIQLGMEGDPKYKDCSQVFDTSYAQMAGLILNAKVLVGIDTVSMHMAAALDTPHVAIFGSSYSTSTGPTKSKSLSVLIDTPNRYSCEKACYKYECSVDKEHPCINEIQPYKIVEQALRLIALHSTTTDFMDSLAEYQEHSPKLSGYTHILNAKSQGFPYLESIGSMLGFCDEVIVVEGGSTDGTKEELLALAKTFPHLQIIDREWDWKEPGMDGMQKAFGRAMCTGEFLWQQDADEVVSKEDFAKIKKLVKKFPRKVDLLHLPVIELWGSRDDVRTSRHSWKWRLSRNNFRITHGIVKHARLIDEKTGNVYSKPGMSDGCEYIDIMDHEYIPHAGFYSQELETLRRTNPTAYGKKMNEIFDDLPSIFHYSWSSLERKIKNFKTFWNACWSNLYNEKEPTDRFPDVNVLDEASVFAKVEFLKKQGDEHNAAPLFKLRRQNPVIMEQWLKVNKL